VPWLTVMAKFRPDRDLGSLRFQLPLLLMLYCAAVGLVLYFVADEVQQARFERDFERDQLLRATDIQSRTERAAERGELQTAQREFGELAVFEEVRAAVLVSPENQVVLSSRRDWAGRPLDLGALGLGPAERERVEAAIVRARATGRTASQFSTDRNELVIVMPAALPLGPGDLRVDRRALIVLVHDLRFAKAVNAFRLRQQFAMAMLGVLLAGLGLGVTLHFFVTGRIERLHGAMRRFAAGEAVDDEQGRRSRRADEISQLHRHFTTVAATIGREIAVRRQAEDALRESEERFRSAMHHSPIGMALVSTDGRFLEVNPALCAIVGYTREELLSSTLKGLTHPDDLKNDMTAMARMLNHELDTFQTVERCFHKDGRILWVLLNASLIEDDSERPRYVVTQILDITERKRADEELRQVNRALRTISNCNQVLVHATDESSLLHEICAVVVKHGGYRMAWVGFAIADDKQSVRPVAHAGFEDGYLAVAPVTWSDASTGGGPTAAAIRTGRPAVSHDFLSDPEGGPWSDEALARGYKSALALPLDGEGRVFGALTIYSSEDVTFDAAEVTWLKELADDLAFGIQALRTRISQRLVEEALRTSQSKLEMTMDMAGLAHWELDTLAGMFTFEERVFRQLGTTAADEGGLMMPMDVYTRRFIPLEDLHILRDLTAQADASTAPGYAAQFEHRIRRVDGSIGTVQVRISYEKDAAGRVVRVHGANLDITERKRAAAEVVAMNERYARQEAALTTLTRSYVGTPDDFTPIVRDITEVVATTLEVARVGVWRHDDRGTSTRCQDLFEWPQIRHSSGVEFSEESCPVFFRSLAEADVIAAHDAPSDPRTSELAGPYLTAHEITSMMSVPIHSQGSTVGVLSCMHKGTPRRWTPDEQTFALAVANLLSAIIAQVERQRLEQQLRQAQKLEAIGQLAGGVAHDFNNILTVILGRAEDASLDARLPDDLRDAIADISQNAERATGLTRQLLAFSRRQTIQVTDVDMNAVVGNLTRMLDRILGEDVVVEFTYAARPVHVRADRGMIEQVLLNLAVNARDAMPLGGHLAIETSVVEGLGESAGPARPPGTWVCLQVTDTGSGIATEHLAHIFEPFFTTKDVGKGTGLGLATTYGIVQQHGGWIEVDSQVDRGTTFRVFFPHVAASRLDVVPPAAPAPSPRGDETILVVEDEEGVRALVIKVLSDLGYQLLQAQSGPSAIEVWREHGPSIDMLITDIVMPDGMNGIELAERLRRNRPALKVIYTSGYLADVSRDDIPSRETDAYLAKPFSLPELARMVRRTLDAGEPMTGR
jgi:PAS domain S-box-containing protein